MNPVQAREDALRSSSAGVRPASMEGARAQRTAANHDGSIAHLNAPPRITRALSLRTGRGGVTKLLLDRRMNQKQCATSQNPWAREGTNR